MLTLLTIACAIATTEPQPNDEGRPQPKSQPDPKLCEMFPGIWLAKGVVQFKGEIAINAHHPDTPDVHLEMLVTSPDSREHESLVVTPIVGEYLHAALLAAEFNPGAPLHRDPEGQLIPAHGDAVEVLVALVDEDGEPDAFAPITDWVVRIDTHEPLAKNERWAGLVFAGSRLTGRGYAASRSGTLISLTTFGDEVIAPTWTVSSSAAIDEPVWIANTELLPKQGAPVLVRIRATPKPEPGAGEMASEQADDEAAQPPQPSQQPERVDVDGHP